MTAQPPYSPASVQPVPKTSTLAIVSLVSGIASWLLVPILGSIIAVITGHMARKEIRQNAGQLTGDGLAVAGLVLGYLQLVFVLVPVCLIVILALLGPAIGNVFSNIVQGI